MSKPDGHLSVKAYMSMLRAGELVKISLSASDQTFNILKAKLIQHSAYFRGILQCTIVNDITEPIHLDDVTREVLNRVIFFIYENKLILSAPAKVPSISNLITTIDMYIFADKYDFLKLRNHCVTSTHRVLGLNKSSLNEVESEVWQALNKAFTKLPPTAKLYEMLFAWLWLNMTVICGSSEKRFTKEGYERMIAGLPHFIITELLRHWTVDSYAGVDCTLHHVDHYLEVEEDNIPSLS